MAHLIPMIMTCAFLFLKALLLAACWSGGVVESILTTVTPTSESRRSSVLLWPTLARLDLDDGQRHQCLAGANVSPDQRRVLHCNTGNVIPLAEVV
jgi:hypothetical protein